MAVRHQLVPLHRGRWLALLLCAAGLPGTVVIAGHAHAATVYRCVQPVGGIAFRDTPCGAGTHQRTLDVEPQPLIGAPGEHAARMAALAQAEAAARTAPARPQRARPSRLRRAPARRCDAAAGDGQRRAQHCHASARRSGRHRRTRITVKVGHTQRQPAPTTRMFLRH